MNFIYSLICGIFLGIANLGNLIYRKKPKDSETIARNITKHSKEELLKEHPLSSHSYEDWLDFIFSLGLLIILLVILIYLFI